MVYPVAVFGSKSRMAATEEQIKAVTVAGDIFQCACQLFAAHYSTILKKAFFLEAFLLREY